MMDMKLSRFEQCCQAYGSHRARWPASDHALYDYFAQNENGASLLAEAELLDNFLNSFESEVTSNEEVILRLTSKKPTPRLHYALPAAAFFICAALGGIWGYQQAENASDTSMLSQLLLGPVSSQEIEK
jgi:hypothetical protein